MEHRSLAVLLVLALIPTGGCTFEPGTSFATLSPTLRSAYVVGPDRDAGDGWQTLSNDYQVKVTGARLELQDIALLAGAAGGATSFDPANPPPGYSLCHNGHCHSADGRLVPYAEVEASIAGAGNGGGLQPVVALAVDAALDLTAPSQRPLGCEPSCELERTHIVRASAPPVRLVLEGMVRDGPTPSRLPGELRFTWDLQGGGDAGPPLPALDAALDLPADRKHDPQVTLLLDLHLGPSLFDGIDFAALTAAEGSVELGVAAQERLLRNLREGSFLTATVSRN